MAQLVLPPEADPRNRRRVDNSNGNVYYLRSQYSTPTALEDLVYYIIQAGDPDGQEKMLYYGAVGANVFGSPKEIIEDFQKVQSANDIDKRNGRKAYHEILEIDPEEVRRYSLSPEDLWFIALKCSKDVYFAKGFQTFFAVHTTGRDNFHIHFLVNSISIMDGKKWQSSPEAFRWREKQFNQILKDYYVNKRI